MSSDAHENSSVLGAYDVDVWRYESVRRRAEFIDKQGGASEAELEGLEEELLPRDRPKAVIVAGTWLIYGSGLIVNLVVLSLAMSGRFEALVGVFWFFGSLAGAGLCTYLLYRSLKNYSIHKRRAQEEAEESGLLAA